MVFPLVERRALFFNFLLLYLQPLLYFSRLDLLIFGWPHLWLDRWWFFFLLRRVFILGLALALHFFFWRWGSGYGNSDNWVTVALQVALYLLVLVKVDPFAIYLYLRELFICYYFLATLFFIQDYIEQLKFCVFAHVKILLIVEAYLNQWSIWLWENDD